MRVEFADTATHCQKCGKAASAFMTAHTVQRLEPLCKPVHVLTQVCLDCADEMFAPMKREKTK